MYSSIVTHGDLDGVASAALCSWAYGVNRIVFTGPVEVQSARVRVTAADIVCDLPCPSECGLWFDHHQGNFDDLGYRGRDPGAVPGRFAAERSCARVVLGHLADEGRAAPAHFEPLVAAVDVVDSFDYADVGAWRADTPAHALENAMKAPFTDARERNQFFRHLAFHLRDFGLEPSAALPEVRRYRAAYRVQEERTMDLLRADARPFDERGDVVLVDLTRHNQRPSVWKNLAQLLFPDAGAILAAEAVFRAGRKTTDLALSMSLTIRQNRSGVPKDVGEVMRVLNIGDGHPGAGAGRVACRSREEMVRRKEDLVGKIVSLWRAQGREGDA